MTDTAEHVLLHIKYLDDHAAAQPTLQGVVSGASLRVVARQSADGRVKVSGSVSHRIHRLRASGKTFRYWDQRIAVSLARTEQDLVVLRTLSTAPKTAPKKATTQHLFDGDSSQIVAMVNHLQNQLFEPMPVGSNRPRFVEGPTHGIMDALDGLVDEIADSIGDLPSVDERFPLLTDANRFALSLYGHSFFLDARDYRRVAENVFGKTRYRKPLAREIERLTNSANSVGRSNDFRILNWFRLFRGLVPIDWIIDSMRATPRDACLPFKPNELVEARRLLRRVPKPILRRILTEPAQQAIRIIRDTVAVIGFSGLRHRDLDLLPALIAARGQKRIRGAQDLETLVQGMPAVRLLSAPFARSERAVAAMSREARERREMEAYNEAAGHLDGVPSATWELWQDSAFRAEVAWLLADHRRELMDARERERAEREEQHRQERLARETERATWAAVTAERLDGLAVEDLRVVVARDADTLAHWGAALNNCIGSYSHRLGLDVFAAVVDPRGRVRLNIHIAHEDGITQFLGAFNRDAARELGGQAQKVLSALVGAGAPLSAFALGVTGLTDTAAPAS